MVDLVVGGCDFSGTTSQVNGLIKLLTSSGKTVRDIRGTEIDALFHAREFEEFNKDYQSLKEFLGDSNIAENRKKEFVYNANDCLINGLKVASCKDNWVSTYIDPNSADVWVMEEPTHRGAGQVNRVIEQNRSQFGSKFNPFSAALFHQGYRTQAAANSVICTPH